MLLSHAPTFATHTYFVLGIVSKVFFYALAATPGKKCGQAAEYSTPGDSDVHKTPGTHCHLSL